MDFRGWDFQLGPGTFGGHQNSVEIHVERTPHCNSWPHGSKLPLINAPVPGSGVNGYPQKSQFNLQVSHETATLLEVETTEIEDPPRAVRNPPMAVVGQTIYGLVCLKP